MKSDVLCTDFQANGGIATFTQVLDGGAQPGGFTPAPFQLAGVSVVVGQTYSIKFSEVATPG
jgi:hypothetical protein